MTESLEYNFKYISTDSLEIHPMANIMPSMDKETYDGLVKDIGTFGVKTPIMVLKGTNKIIDGRHRWRAAKDGLVDSIPIVEIEPESEGLDFFIMSLEEYRKNTTVSQIAMIASALTAKITLDGNARRKEKVTSNLKQNHSTDDGTSAIIGEDLNEPEETHDSLANKLGIGEKTLREASRIQEQGTEEDVREVIEGEVSVKKKIAEVRERKSKVMFNKQTGDSIEWAKWSWNPITGCEHTCKYCYARDIAERFRGTDGFPNGFDHTFREERLVAPVNMGKPKGDEQSDKNVFMGSMTDFWGAWQKVAEQQQVMDAIKNGHSEWQYLSLTKDIWNVLKTGIDIPDNFWIGATVDNKKVLSDTLDELNKIKKKFPNITTWISFEPMFTNMVPTLEKYTNDFPDWFVIGGASKSSKTPKYEVPFTQVVDFYNFTRDKDILLYMKTNLIKRIIEVPEEL